MTWVSGAGETPGPLFCFQEVRRGRERCGRMDDQSGEPKKPDAASLRVLRGRLDEAADIFAGWIERARDEFPKDPKELAPLAVRYIDAFVDFQKERLRVERFPTAFAESDDHGFNPEKARDEIRGRLARLRDAGNRRKLRKKPE
jgi:hypothetical protein